MKYLLSVTLLLAIGLQQIDAHGMMLNPPSRSSRWRYDGSAPQNWNDNELFCGGLYVSELPRGIKIATGYDQVLLLDTYRPRPTMVDSVDCAVTTSRQLNPVPMRLVVSMADLVSLPRATLQPMPSVWV